MVESNREAWHDITKRTQDVGADGIELNFGCPHGMSERGQGSAVGQVPEYACMITEWVKEVATIPVIVKLTPNVGDITVIGRAAVNGGADALSLINTVNSIMSVDLDTFAPRPHVRGHSSHGGYAGPAVKPIALHMVSALASDPKIRVPISGIGGIQAWQDAIEFMLLGAGSVQVCTAVMHYGFRIVEHLVSGLEGWMLEKGFSRSATSSASRFRESRPGAGWISITRSSPRSTSKVHPLRPVLHRLRGRRPPVDSQRPSSATRVRERNGYGQQLHRSGGMEVFPGAGGDSINTYHIKQNSCVGCNLCSLVCPVEECITMKDVDTGKPVMSWNEYQALLAAGKVEKLRPPDHV